MWSLPTAHKFLLADLPPQVDLFALTSPENRVAVVGWGQPTEALPFGYVIIASHARSVLSALDWLTAEFAVDDPTIKFPGWVPPFSHVIAVERESADLITTVGWSAHSTNNATLGQVRAPVHGDFPLEIDVVSVPASRVLSTRRDMTLTLIANLSHLDVFLPGLT